MVTRKSPLAKPKRNNSLANAVVMRSNSLQVTARPPSAILRTYLRLPATNYCQTSASGVTPVVTCDASIMTRVRLNPSQIASPGTGTITVNNIPSTNGQTTSISYPITLVTPSPAIVSAVPDSYPQGTSTQFSTDGGYYGGGNSPLVNLLFNGTLSLATAFGPRQFTGYLQGSSGPLNGPGLYPVSIVEQSAVWT